MRNGGHGRRGGSMTAAGRSATGALAVLLRDQPLSPGKVSLAWSVAVGHAVARAATVALGAEGTLTVTVDSPHWAREIRRSRPLIAARLNELLGTGVVTRIEIGSPSRTDAEERQPHARIGHRRRRASAHR